MRGRGAEALMSESRFSNELSDAQLERLAILSEELGEAQQAIGKILRHGYESVNPLLPSDQQVFNRAALERECGDIYEAILMLCHAGDISDAGVNRRQAEKHESIQRWLHHQVGK
jgi:NTP pyrophosphatase (non-canonical NTP hydrolase)